MILFIIMLAVSAGTLIFPSTVLWMQPALEPLFAVTMFFVGSLVRREEISIFKLSPLRPILGVLGQYTIMPLIAFAISLFFENPSLRVGIVLVGCMPGAMASNVMTLLIKGDLVFSVIMTTLATLISPLVLAFWLPILADTSVSLPIWKMVFNVVWMVVIPVIAGATIRTKLEAMPRWWHRLATAIASISIVLIISVVVAVNRTQLIDIGGGLLMAMLGLNLLAYGAAFAMATGLNWHPKQRRTFIIEVGMQNAGMGSVLALQHLDATGAVPSAFYTALCVFTAASIMPLQKLMTFMRAKKTANQNP